MKKRILILAALIFLIPIGLFFYCTKEPEEKVCNVKNPIKDLPWLCELVNQYKKEEGSTNSYIYQCIYNNGMEGFYIEPCGNCTTYEAYLYNCSGDKLLQIRERDYPGILNEWNIEIKKLIWTNTKNYY